MALATRILKAHAKTCVNTIVDAIDAGTGAGYIELRDGSQPVDVDTTAAGSVVRTITLAATAFGAATTGTGTQDDMAIAELASSPTDTGATSGTPTWFRAYDSDANAVIDGSVATATADMILDNTSITSGQTVTVTAWTVRLPFRAVA